VDLVAVGYFFLHDKKLLSTTKGVGGVKQINHSLKLLSRSWLSRSLVIVLFLLLLSATGGPVAAQEEQPTTDPALVDELQRGLQREAPQREPRVLRAEVLPSGLLNQVVELPPVADAYIASERPNQNFGADSLYLGFNNIGDRFGAQRILIRFDVGANVPDGATVNSARLRLRVAFSSPPNDATMNTVLRRVASNWSESGVTWNLEPAWTGVDASAGVGSALDWYEWDVTDITAGWVDGSYPNYGMLIIGDEQVQQRERAFYSRETTSDFFPRLVVDYTVETDDEPPVVTVESLPPFSSRNFTVSWSGTDPGGSGIACYDVQFRIDGGDWVDWFTCTTQTSAEFPDGEHGRLYEFRARGIDNVGNVEDFGDVEASTVVDIRPPTAQVLPLPLITITPQFIVRWTGDDRGGSPIQHYDIRYRLDGGPWILWQQQTIATEALFVTTVDGHYEFEARAVDERGQVEDFTDAPDAGTVVDAREPLFPRVHSPFLLYNAEPGLATN
jgi:hypothetical protein